MRVEINTANEAAKMRQLNNFLRDFINDKIHAVREHQEDASCSDDRSDSIWKKYVASLWMVSLKMNMLGEQEIAMRAGVSQETLRAWMKEKYFNALVAENYREFLECIISVLT